ncbi:zinc finger protein OZF-like [Sabethes cyaneus]|uniref:zinc finger protein OZF-like n=1 Tax=Sabethes cyaneus TaxID=53552 RepID=UPI00237D9B71|nr:zinc finger protein OZF-like [Sabethes cyaneus]
MEISNDTDDFSGQNFMCRVCTSTNLLINIFLNEAHNIAAKIQICASVQIAEDDDLPHHICSKCYTDLEIAFAFRSRCEESDMKLRQLFNNIAKEEELSIKSENDDDNAELINQNQNTYVDSEDNSSNLNFEHVSCELSQDYTEIAETISGDSKSQLSQGRTKQIVKSLICEACDKVLPSRNEYFAHVKTHGKRRFRCKICDKWLARRSSFLQHQRGHLGVSKQYSCKICKREFRFRNSLQRHISGVHNRLRNFTCTLCGSSFAQKTHLQVHAATHIGQPYKCSKCPATYRSERFLLRHEQFHLPPEERNNALIFEQKSYKSTTQKKFICEYCGKIFNNQATYVVHTRMHTKEKPYNCIYCEKKFVSSSLRKKHMKTHTGEKPFKCDICGRCFREKAHLTTHGVTHKQDRNHVCPICSKAFKLKSILNSHMKCHSVCNKNLDSEKL